jgi:dTDP-4-dehydrorhamnose reductase
MRVLVLGANGMLGHKLVQRLAEGVEVWGTVRSDALSGDLVQWLGSSRLLTRISAQSVESLVHALRLSRADAVVNCIGIVKQRESLEDIQGTVATNSLFPHQLAQLCALGGARLVHLSTDCVFSGRKGKYVETDSPDPGDLYGRTKLLGEVTGSGCLTIRTSMVGWQLSRSTGLLEWLATQRNARVTGFRRVTFSGLSTSALSDVLAALLDDGPGLEGIYHVSSEPINKYELLSRIVDAMGWPTEVIPVDEPVCDRSLDSEAFRARTGWNPPAWDQMIDGLVSERPLYEKWRDA